MTAHSSTPAPAGRTTSGTAELKPTRTVDSLFFGTRGAASDARPSLDGEGFLIDNLTLTSASMAPCQFTVTGTTMTLVADCETITPIIVPGGYTLDGAGHTITVPAGTLFNGGVIENTPGQTDERE